MFQGGAIPQSQLLNSVRDVELDGVQADVQTLADLRIGHAVAHGIDHAPLGGSEDVGMTWAAALPACGAHEEILALKAAEFPSPFVTRQVAHVPSSVQRAASGKRRSLHRCRRGWIS